MGTSQRPGQVRFEAWVPEDLYRAFQAKIDGDTTRKAWLVAALRSHVWGPEGCKHTKRVQMGHKESLGAIVPVYACAYCGEALTA